MPTFYHRKTSIPCRYIYQSYGNGMGIELSLEHFGFPKIRFFFPGLVVKERAGIMR